jgi:hypothetical protein
MSRNKISSSDCIKIFSRKKCFVGREEIIEYSSIFRSDILKKPTLQDFYWFIITINMSLLSYLTKSH